MVRDRPAGGGGRLSHRRLVSPRPADRWASIRDPQQKFATQALLCTDVGVTPGQILAWLVQRWQLEVTFEEARRHLGLETQRQWSDLAIARTTPALLGLFSLVTLLADQRLSRSRVTIPLPTWSRKDHFTFADAWLWSAVSSGPTRLSGCPASPQTR